MPSTSLRNQVDWSSLTSLRLLAKFVVDGLFAGPHRSLRRGPGIEFGGYRAYTPGDDLRWLDRRSLLLHDRMLVRQFETEAQRELRLVVDSTTSMGYRGESSAISKLRYASIVSAALSRVAILGGDAVSLAVLGTGWKQGVAKRSGQEHFERILAKLESLEAQGDALADPSIVVRPLAQLSNRSSRGTVTVVLSDFLDWPNDVHSLLSGSCGHQRTMIMLQILEPDEVSFPFDSSIRLRGMEGRDVVETNGSDVRLGYLAALEQSQRQWQTFITSKGGKWLSCQSNDDPVTVVRRILEMAR